MKHFLLLFAAAAGLAAADATGTWSGTITVPNREGGERTQPARLVLRQEGEKLTGTAGPSTTEQHSIQNGKAENGVLTFELPTGDFVMKFSLKQDGDQITGEATRSRDGRTETAKFAFKRDQ